MKKLKQCAACRYCRVNSFVKISAVLLVGVVATIVMTFEAGM
jgi:hypothetical protein